MDTISYKRMDLHNGSTRQEQTPGGHNHARLKSIIIMQMHPPLIVKSCSDGWTFNHLEKIISSRRDMSKCNYIPTKMVQQHGYFTYN